MSLAEFHTGPATRTGRIPTIDRWTDRAFTIAVGLIVCVYVFRIRLIAPGFMSVGFAGITFTHLYWYRTLRDYAACALGTTLLYTLYLMRHPPELFPLVALAGLASVAVLAARWSHARGDERRNIETVARLPVFVLLFANVAEIPQLATFAYHTRDSDLFRLDAQLGQPSWLIGTFVPPHSWLHGFTTAWYVALGLGMMAVLAPEAHRTKRVVTFMGALVATGLLGFLIYTVIPAVGPTYAYQGFPVLSSARLYTDPTMNYPKNSFPSLHMAWCILMLLHARRRWTKVLAGLFVVFIAIATLGLGEHYAVDLLVAVPFTIVINDWVAHRRVCWSAGLLTLLWVVVARYPGAPHAALLLASITLCWVAVTAWNRMGRRAGMRRNAREAVMA